MLSHSFPPIESPDSRLLILGSMPGQRSLQVQQYYAHPRNAFWRIMGELFDAGPELPYEERTRLLRAQGVALWDSIASCLRPGSLDADIDEDSIASNDFSSFFAAHPKVRNVYFNGTKSEAVFRRHVLRRDAMRFGPLKYQRLPSTSMAHAGRSYAEKLALWRTILE